MIHLFFHEYEGRPTKLCIALMTRVQDVMKNFKENWSVSLRIGWILSVQKVTSTAVDTIFNRGYTYYAHLPYQRYQNNSNTKLRTEGIEHFYAKGSVQPLIRITADKAMSSLLKIRKCLQFRFLNIIIYKKSTDWKYIL